MNGVRRVLIPITLHFLYVSLNSVCKEKSTVGWLRLVGSLKLYVSFAKEPCGRDYILQKRPIILSLLIVAAPYVYGKVTIYMKENT